MVDAAVGPAYHRVALSARPTRLAVALPVQDAWKRDALHALEALSRFWGGAGDVLFFADESMPAPVWRALEEFDADVFGYYFETFGAWRKDEPNKYEEWLNKTIERFIAEGSVNDEPEWRRQLTSDSVLSDARVRWRPSDAITSRILETMSSLRWRESVFSATVSIDQTPSYRFADTVRLEPRESRPVLALDVSAFGEDVELSLASRTGLVGDAHGKALADAGIVVQRVEVPTSSLVGALEYAWAGDLPGFGRSWLRSFSNLDHASTPFGRSIATCGWFGRDGWPPAPFVFVVGDTRNDFALGLIFNRVTQAATWLPRRLLEGSLQPQALRALASTISNLSSHPSGERSVTFTSTSMTVGEVEGIKEMLGPAMLAPDDLQHVSVVEADVLTISNRYRLWDTQVNQRATSEAFLAGIQSGPVPTPVATVSTPERGTDVGWMVDADVADHRVPTRSPLDDLIAVTRPFERQVRPSRDGVSYYSFGGFIDLALPLELNLSRPTLVLPSAEAIFGALLARAGLRAEPSAAGAFAARIEHLWGSLEAVAASLSTGAESRMLRAYLSEADSEVEPGVRLDVPGRRFLTFKNFRDVGALSVDETREVLDSWVTRGILRRGLILRCDVCLSSGWYDIGDVGASFTCQRCRQPNALVAQAWKLPASEPEWYYDLAEPVYQALRGHVHAPIFCLRALQKDASSFLFTHEMNVFGTTGLVAETDLWAIKDGRIIVGETTTTDDFGGSTNKKLRAVQTVADAVTADEVVFATTAPVWSANVATRVDDMFARRRPRVRLLVGKDLVS